MLVKPSDCHLESGLKGRHRSLECCGQLKVFPQITFLRWNFVATLILPELCPCQEGQKKSDFSTLHLSCFTPLHVREACGPWPDSLWLQSVSRHRPELESRLLMLREKTNLGKGKSWMSPKEQWSWGFVFLRLSLRLLFCLNISTIFLTSVSVLKQRSEAKCLMKRAWGRGVQVTWEEGLGRGEERRVRLQVHTFSQNFLKIWAGDANSGTHGSPMKLPSGP